MDRGEARGNGRPITGRSIGPLGTATRVVVGIAFLAPAATGRFGPEDVAVGLGVFPTVLFAWHWRRRRAPSRLDATGPWGFAINAAVFLALYLTPLYAPPLAATSDGVLIFYGTSMLLAAMRGYAGCEVLAISNWLLRRNDQVGCLLFSPIDAIERRGRSARQATIRSTLRGSSRTQPPTTNPGDRRMRTRRAAIDSGCPSDQRARQLGAPDRND